jgi:protein gp37
MRREWVISVRDLCRTYHVPFFFQQWGGVRKSKNGRLLDDRTYDEYPERISVPIPDRQRCAAYAQDILNSFA